MKTTITINGFKYVKDLPKAYREVTFRQYLALKPNEKFNLHRAVSVFTGIDEETLEKAQVRNLDQVNSLLSFLRRDVELALPERISVVKDGKTWGFDIVKDLETESVAQYADITEIISKFKENDVIGNASHFPLICATYAVKPYNFKHAEEIAKLFWDAPCTEVMAVGSFTVAKLMASSSGIPRVSRRAVIPLNSWRRAMKSLLRRLVSTIQYVFWRVSLPLSVRRFLDGK